MRISDWSSDVCSSDLSSMLNVINGFYSPNEGSITYKGETRRRMRPHEAASRGIARTFRNVALFKGMSVLDNIMTGRLLKMKGFFLLDAMWYGPARRRELENRAFVERIIDFLEIPAIRKTPTGRLRSERRRGGKEWGSKGKTRGAP